jgi:hypothetical protein
LDKQIVDVDERAENMFLRLVREMAEREGVTEALKADTPNERPLRNTAHSTSSWQSHQDRSVLTI